MKVLLYGSGAREHALAQKICKSPILEKLYLAGANDGFCNLGEVINFCDYEELAKKALEYGVDLLVVGPEKPLTEGICDIFAKKNIRVFGANAYWAQLEGSKIFAKEFMKKNGIKTADYKIVSDLAGFEAELLNFDNPPVIKLDGLAGGKGVFVPESFDDAKMKWCGKKILLEERLYGRELSVFSIWDGKTLLNFPPACDYKKLLNGDFGSNTGGMGSAFPCILSNIEQQLLDEYLLSLESALKISCAKFCGVVYSGLMLNAAGAYVLEYNMRFGDPEIQSVLENLQNDILEVFDAATRGRLDKISIKFAPEPSYCVVLASKGYPDNPKKGAEIFNIDSVIKKYGVKIYFAGVKKQDGSYYVNGGRILSICKSGNDALYDIYKAADEIEYEGKIFRDDIKLR